MKKNKIEKQVVLVDSLIILPFGSENYKNFITVERPEIHNVSYDYVTSRFPVYNFYKPIHIYPELFNFENE